MPAKKAAKKAAKKTAKKVAGKHADHHAGKDVRRAYEHLGRLEAIQNLLSAPVVKQVGRLSEFAQMAMSVGDGKSAAELLRAAEHFSFASLAPAIDEKLRNTDLVDTLTAEFYHVRDRAEDHWGDDETARGKVVARMFAAALAAGDAALSEGSYRRAMEYVRAADALAHTDFAETRGLPGVNSAGRLSV